MKSHIKKITAVLTMIGLFSTQSQASWLSDALGVNIDPWAGKFQIGMPQRGRAIQQLPGVIQRLPQDAANLLNPMGLALAASVRQAEAQASYGARPIPFDVYQQLQPFFPPDVLQSVRFNTFDSTRITLDSAVMLLNNDVAAITLNSIVVFRGENEAQNSVVWAHELTHVLQYRARGIDTFANTYTTNAWILENEAKDAETRIDLMLSGNLQAAQQFAYFFVTGQYLYGDAIGNLYPADPRNGIVVGPPNGRVYFQSGQYWAVDMYGRTWPAQRVR
jgi:hypothetical protein